MRQSRGDGEIMTNSRETNDMGPVSDASRYYYDDLVEAGAQIFEKQDATLHSKTMTVDGKFSIIGSVNLNGRSQWRDSSPSSQSVARTSLTALTSAFNKASTAVSK